MNSLVNTSTTQENKQIDSKLPTTTDNPKDEQNWIIYIFFFIITALIFGVLSTIIWKKMP